MDSLNWEQLAKNRQEENQKLLEELNKRTNEFLEQNLRQAQAIKEIQNQMAALEDEKSELSFQLEELRLQGYDQAARPSSQPPAALSSELKPLSERVQNLEAVCTRILRENLEMHRLLTRLLSAATQSVAPVNVPTAKSEPANVATSLPKAVPSVEIIQNGKEAFLPEQPQKPIVSVQERPLVAYQTSNSVTSTVTPNNSLLTYKTEKLKDYTGKKIKGYNFNGSYHKADFWIELVVGLAKTMYQTRRNDFDRCLSIRGEKKPYFTRNKYELRSAKEIVGTAVYVESNISVQRAVTISYKLIKLFGYTESDLEIYWQD